MSDRRPREVKPLHCWEDGPEAEDGCGTTCMLYAGHRGAHVWTRDDEIMIRFVGDKKA